MRGDYIKMDGNDQNAVQFAVAKILSMWALIGVSSWTEAAAVMGFVYTLCLLLEWLYKKYCAFKEWQARSKTTAGGK